MARHMLNRAPVGLRAAAIAAVLALGALLALGGPARAAEADDQLALLARLGRQRIQLEKEREAAAARYQARTAEIAQLKAQPSSWSRDRKLQKLLAESRDMANALDRKDAELRGVAERVAATRASAVAAIDRELAAAPGPDAARRATLTGRRAELAASSTANARRIKVADETIDPLDDPEDLEEKADALRRSESQLREEIQRLGRRAVYYRHQVKLAEARKRTDESEVFVAAGPRTARGRTPSGAPASPGSADDESPPPFTGEPNFEGDGVTVGPSTGGTRVPPATADLTVDPSVVLVEVVEKATLEELRKAERSGDAAARARAAERARIEVEQRAERLRLRRLEMERRARELRAE